MSIGFYGKTIYLEGKIDLNNKNWNPIGTLKYFYGKFNGKNNTIYNLKLDGSNYSGLFGLLAGAEIKDLNIENVNISNCYWGGSVASYSCGNTVIENVNVTGNVTLSGLYYIGGIIGQVKDNTTIKNINMNGNITISGQYITAGIVAEAQNNTIVQDTNLSGNIIITGPYYVAGVSGYITGVPTIKNVKIEANEESKIVGTASDSINNAGGIVGNCVGSYFEGVITYATIEDCTSNIDVIISGAGAGGIAGYIDATKIKNCTSGADVILDAKASDEEYLTIGGISGYTCNSDNTISSTNNVILEECTFNGNLIYKVNGEAQSNVEFSNNGIAGCDRLYTSQNLKIINCSFNDNLINN